VATKPSSASDQARARLVSRLSLFFAIAVVAQAAAFIALSEAYQFASGAAVGALASSGAGQGALTLQASLIVIGFLFDLFLALVIGFYGSRLLARSIVRTMPRGKKPPLQPIPFAALCAAALIIAFTLFEAAAAQQPLGAAAWLLLLVRPICVGVLLWYAARRALMPKAA
jgi:hypothetical protein